MSQEIKAWRRSGKGRPRNQDREQVLAYFAAHLAIGRTVSALARKGFALMSHRRGAERGTKIPLEFEIRQGKTLERAYRVYRQEVRDAVFSHQGFQRRAEAKGLTVTNIETRYIGIRAPRPPLSFPEVEHLSRGRPGKVGPR